MVYTPDRAMSYSYDSLGRLVQDQLQQNVPGSAATTIGGVVHGDIVNPLIGSGSHSWSYDNAGNVTEQSDSGNATVFLNPDNQLYEVNPGYPGQLTFSYDAAGNQLTDLLTPFLGKASTTASGNETYDPEERLSSSSVGGMAAGYDDDGSRAWRTNPDGSTVYYVYDESGLSGNVPLAEYGANGVPLAVNYCGPTGWLARWYPDYVQQPDGEFASEYAFTDYFTYDPQGNPVERLRWFPAAEDDGAGGEGDDLCPYLLDQSEYDSWGNLLTDFDFVDQNEEQIYPGDSVGAFSQWGYQTDPQTGLILAGHRYYQPSNRRWLNQDPIGLSGGVNLYEYAGDDPVNRRDPDGNQYTDPNQFLARIFDNSTLSDWENVFEHNDVTHALKALWRASAYVPLPDSPATDARIAETAVIGVEKAADSAPAAIAGAKALAASTKAWFRYMSEGELKAVMKTSLLRGGRPGRTYWTDASIKSASTATRRLSLETSPTYRVEFEITNHPNIQGGTRAAAKYGQIGGGREYYTEDPVHVRIINAQPVGPRP